AILNPTTKKRDEQGEMVYLLKR
ncbi:ATP-dependent DNA helicase RecQ domain protein, partial [Vibrio parahaemolyticus V-223/04]